MITLLAIQNVARKHMMGTRSAEAPAKINLGLRILRKREDGYHDLETGMIAIGLADKITVGHAEGLTMSCTDPALPTDDSNLCLKAANTIRERFAVDAGAHIHLDKRIPSGAGLGGGSSDAATTMRLLADLWSLDISDDLMREMSNDFGSDIAFFVSGEPAVATGIGTTLTSLKLPESVSGLWVGVVHSGVHVSTGDAYSGCVPRENQGEPIADILTGSDPLEWSDTLENDFEGTVFKLHPSLADLKRSLTTDGAIYAAMSGSGSAVFGLFSSHRAAIQALANTHMRNWCGQMLV